MDGDIRTNAQTRRRLGGAVLLLAGIVIAAVVLWPGGDGTSTGTRARLPIRIVSVPPLGLGFAHPTSWKRKVANRVIGLRSPDGSVVVFLSSPVGGPHVAQVKAAAQAQLLKRFKPAKIVSEASQPLGQRSVSSFELRGVDQGKPIRALEMVDSTDYRTYAVSVVTTASPSRARLKEARAIIGTVRFSRPQTLPTPK